MAQIPVSVDIIINRLLVHFKEAFNLAVEKYKDKLKEMVIKEWYSKYDPKGYTRTLELLDSITWKYVKEGASSFTIEIFYDTDKIHPYPATEDEWGKHEGTFGDRAGEDVSEAIPLWVEEGIISPVFTRPGGHPVEKLTKWERSKHFVAQSIAAELRKKGWAVWINDDKKYM